MVVFYLGGKIMIDKIDKEEDNKNNMSYEWRPLAISLIITIIIIIIAKVFFHM